MTYTLILLRHGESDWNAKNLFTGWVDVGLTEKGQEAVRGGEQLREADLLPDVVHTSVLRRAISTACISLDAATGTGSRSAAPGASTSVTTARCRARTRSRRWRSTARSSSCSGAARSTYPRR